MSTETQWVRSIVGRGPQCPVCGHKGGCLIAKDGSAAICQRVEQGCATFRDGRKVVAKNGMGWVHRLAGKQAAEAAKSIGLRKPADSRPPIIAAAEWRRIIYRQQREVDPVRLRDFAHSMGLSVRALIMLGIGWDIDSQCWAFPMYDGTFTRSGEPVPCGVRLRSEAARDAKGNIVKRAMKGSRNGLFIPAGRLIGEGGKLAALDGYTVPEWPLPDRSPDSDSCILLAPEGPTSAAACIDLGFRTVGRPAAHLGGQNMRMLLHWPKPGRQDVVIIKDRDETKYHPDGSPFWPGHEGALGLAADILDVSRTLRILGPPKGMEWNGKRVKDIRDWLRAGLGTLELGLLVMPGRGPWDTEDDDCVISSSDTLAYKREQLTQWKAKMRKPSEHSSGAAPAR